MKQHSHFLFLVGAFLVGIMAGTIACGARTTGPGGGAGTDGTACEVATSCDALPCQSATACTWHGGEPECIYEDVADNSICDLSAAGSGDGTCTAGECSAPQASTCDDNNDCSASQTCVGGLCVSIGTTHSPCDSGDDHDCDSGLICGPDDFCIGVPGAICEANSECLATCVDGRCAELGGGGDACDSGDDSDCAESLVCSLADLCAGPEGTACTSNDSCLATCIGGLCAATGNAGDSCDAGDDSDCEGDLACGVEGLCVLADGSACTENSQCLGTCISGTCAPAAGEGGTCDADDHEDCHSSVCVAGVCGGSINGEIFVFEIDDHIAGTSTTLCEIEFYDGSGAYVSADTTATDAWDTMQDDVPRDWNSASYWYRSNLFDRETLYTVGPGEGYINCTGFHSPSNTAGSGHWARFAVFLDAATDISSIRIAAGSPHSKVPQFIRIYKANDYDFTTNIQNRQDDGMDLIWSYEFTNVDDWLTVGWVEATF